MMPSRVVCLNNLQESVDFIEEISKLPFKAELISGNIVVDAKSILSVIGLAVGRNMELFIHAENAEKILDELSLEGNIIK